MKANKYREPVVEKKLLSQQQPREKINPSKVKKSTDQSILPIKLFGIKIVGMDPRLVQNAKLSLEVPLVAGHRSFLGIDKDAKVKIKDDSVAQIVLELERNREGALSLKEFVFSVNRSITIKNPSASLEVKEDKSRFGTAIKDKIADLKIKEIKIDAQGNIHLNGKLRAFHTFNKRLPKDSTSIKLPTLDEQMLAKLGLIELGPGMKKSSFSKIRERFNVNKLLKSLGAMTKEANYTLSFSADPSFTLLTKDNNFFRGPTSPINVTLQGTTNIEKDGDLLFVIDGKRSQISGSLGIYSPQLSARISNIGEKKPIDIQLQAAIEGVGRDLRLDTFTKQEVKTVMPRRRQLDKSVPVPQSDDEYNTTVGAEKLDLKASLNAQLSIGHGVSVKNAEAQASLVAHKPYAKTHERGITMEGTVSAKIDAEKIGFDKQNGINQGSINARFGINPNKETTEQFSEIKPVDFNYKVEIKGPHQTQITPPPYGFTRFLRPVKNFECHDERVNTEQTKSHISPIGSSRYFKQIERIAGIKIKKADEVELLIDGIKSMPKRIALIESAKNSICFQTLAFKSDASGWQYAEALVGAAKRGVKVYGIIDSLGNIESIEDLKQPNSIYKYLRENGVNLHLYNGFIEQGLRMILSIAQKNPGVFPAHNAHSLLGVAQLLRFFDVVADIADDKHGIISKKDRNDLREGIHIMFSGKDGSSPHNAVSELKKAISGNMTTLDEFLLAIKRVGDASYRWHEKYLIVDGEKAIIGGMNIADEYLRGGTGEIVVIKNKPQPAWRDSDCYIRGEVVDDIAHNFKNNWLHVAKAELKLPECNKAPSKPISGDSYNVGIIHHRPLEDGDHNVTNFLLYNLRTLRPGEKAWLETPYFLPRGALRALQTEMVITAKRGVDLRILTNDEKTSDFGPLVEAAVFDERELLRAGARIFRRNNDRMVHAKVYVLGDKLTMIGSWNMDNRSAAHDSEDICAIFDQRITKEMSEQLLRDMFEQSYEIKLADIDARSLSKEMRSAAMLLMGELL